ncbi:hypothetical protein [Listeria phage 184]
MRRSRANGCFCSNNFSFIHVCNRRLLAERK